MVDSISLRIAALLIDRAWGRAHYASRLSSSAAQPHPLGEDDEGDFAAAQAA
jgi:hypothetical protein